MNDQNQQHSKPSQSALDSGEKLDEVLSCLKGTFDQEGLVSMVRNIHTTLHDKENGLVPRVSKLEKNEDKRTGWVAGVCFIGSVIGVLVGWCAALFGHK